MYEVTSKRFYEPTGKPLSVRAAYAKQITFKLRHQASSLGKLRNLSTSGAYLCYSEHLRIGMPLVLYLPIEFSGVNKMCIVSGYIVRIESGCRTPYLGYGIKFDTDIPTMSKVLLEDLVNFKTHGELTNLGVTDPSLRLPRKDKTRSGVRNPLLQERQLEQLRQKAKKKKQLGLKIPVAVYVAAAGLTFFVCFHMYRGVEEYMWLSRLHSTIPMIEPTLEEGILNAEARSDWITTIPESIKRDNLRALAKKLEERSVHGAQLFDEDGNVVAQILRKNGRNDLVVQLIQRAN